MLGIGATAFALTPVEQALVAHPLPLLQLMWSTVAHNREGVFNNDYRTIEALKTNTVDKGFCCPFHAGDCCRAARAVSAARAVYTRAAQSARAVSPSHPPAPSARARAARSCPCRIHPCRTVRHDSFFTSFSHNDIL